MWTVWFDDISWLHELEEFPTNVFSLNLVLVESFID